MMGSGTPEEKGSREPLKSHRGEIESNAIGRTEGRPVEQDSDARAASPGNEERENGEKEYVIRVHAPGEYYDGIRG